MSVKTIDEHVSAALVDIRYFKWAYPEACPYCEIKWGSLSPLANLAHHWSSECSPTPSVGAAPASEPHRQLCPDCMDGRHYHCISTGCTCYCHDAPAVPQEPLRCLRTENLCGTDTWVKGTSCPCVNCQSWLAAQEPEAERIAEKHFGDLYRASESVRQMSIAVAKEALASKGCSDCQAELESMAEALAASSARVEELTLQRDGQHKMFYKLLGLSDIESHIRNKRAESAEAQLTLVRNTLPELDSVMQFYLNREANSPSNSQEASRRALEKLRKWDALIDKLKPAADQKEERKEAR